MITCLSRPQALSDPGHRRTCGALAQALQSVTAMIVRPDTSVGWATAATAAAETVSAELRRLLGQP